MKDKKLGGVYVPTLIPLKENGNVDYKKMKNYYEFLINSNVNGFMIFGTCGEFTSFSLKEREKITKNALSIINRRVPTIVNCSSTVLKDSELLAKKTLNYGADIISILPPYYTLLSNDAIIKYIEEFCNSIDGPVLLYNVPFSAKNEITPQVMYDLVVEKGITNIVGIKDVSTDLLHLSHMLEVCKKNKLKMFVAMEHVMIPLLLLGAAGTISPITNIVPKKIIEIYKNIKKGNCKIASKIYFEILPLIDAVYLGKNFPATIKKIMKLIGKDVGEVRKPLQPVDENILQFIRIKLKEAKLL